MKMKITLGTSVISCVMRVQPSYVAGGIQVKHLLSSTTSLNQPMDHGVTVSCTTLYQGCYLDEALVVLEEENEEEDTWGQCSLVSVKNYIKSTIYNLAVSWKDVKMTIVSN